MGRRPKPDALPGPVRSKAWREREAVKMEVIRQKAKSADGLAEALLKSNATEITLKLPAGVNDTTELLDLITKQVKQQGKPRGARKSATTTTGAISPTSTMTTH